MRRHVSITRLAVFGGAVALVTVGCSSSTKASNKVDLSGTYNLTAFTLAGQQLPVDQSDGATLVTTAKTYASVGMGAEAQLLTDSGSYTATDTGSVSGAVVGTFQEESVTSGLGVTGSFYYSANKDTLMENVTASGQAIQSTWVKAN